MARYYVVLGKKRRDLQIVGLLRGGFGVRLRLGYFGHLEK